MPIDYKRYPKNWHEFSRKIRFERAKNCCEKCGVPNYAIGFRLDGQFEFWELNDEQTANDTRTITGKNGYAESKELYQFILETEKEEFDDPDYPRPTIIVLTVAHLDRIGDICRCEEKTEKKCAIESHVLAMCQKCHLTYDIERHKLNRRRNRAAEVGQLWLADWDARF